MAFNIDTDIPELKKLIDEYTENLDCISSDEYYETDCVRARNVLYNFLFHLTEMTVDYKELVKERDELNSELYALEQRIKKKGEV